MKMGENLKSPYPWFGGKRKIADMVWQRFGAVSNYVEPFFGSGAVLLARPGQPTTETINDADGFVSNFWRALQTNPDAVAFHADWPVNENDLHARHAWLVGQKDSMQTRLEGDPDWFDAKIAGWWGWGTACWRGSGFCSGEGPWRVVEGQLVHVGNAGQGVNRKRERLGGFSETGVNAQADLLSYMRQLADRMRKVRVCCGDWSRVIGPSVTSKQGLTAVFLDPPYNEDAERADNLYRVDCTKISNAVREWAVAEGANPLMRIALCGYEGEHNMPPQWDCQSWNAGAGFGGQAKEGVNGNGKKERVWFSPHCLPPDQGRLL